MTVRNYIRPTCDGREAVSIGERAAWQSRMPHYMQRGPLIELTDLRQLAKDIRNAPASAHTSALACREYVFGLFAATIASGEYVGRRITAREIADAIAPDATIFGLPVHVVDGLDPRRFYIVRRPARNGSAGLPEAGGTDAGRLEQGGGSDVEAGRTSADVPVAWHTGSGVLRPGVDGSEGSDEQQGAANATCAATAAVIAYFDSPTTARYRAAIAACNAVPTGTGKNVLAAARNTGKTVTSAAAARHKAGMPADAEVKPDCVCSDEHNPDCVPYGPHCLYGVDPGVDGK